MKIQICKESVRYRVSREELVTLLREGSLEERIEFPNGQILRCMALLHMSGGPGFSLSDNIMALELTKAEAERLLQQNQDKKSGVCHDFKSPEGGELDVRFEIDLKNNKGAKNE